MRCSFSCEYFTCNGKLWHWTPRKHQPTVSEQIFSHPSLLSSVPVKFLLSLTMTSLSYYTNGDSTCRLACVNLSRRDRHRFWQTLYKNEKTCFYTVRTRPTSSWLALCLCTVSVHSTVLAVLEQLYMDVYFQQLQPAAPQQSSWSEMTPLQLTCIST